MIERGNATGRIRDVEAYSSMFTYQTNGVNDREKISALAESGEHGEREESRCGSGLLPMQQDSIKLGY